MYLDFIANASLLVSLSVLYDVVSRLRPKLDSWAKPVMGVLFGCVAVAGTAVSFHAAPEIVHDGSSLIMAMSGLFGGATSLLVSAVVAGGYRALLGGPAVWAAIATILVSGALGLAFRRAHDNQPERITIPMLLLLGLLVEASMLACHLLVQPWPSGISVIRRIWLPVMLVLPVATVLMGLLLGVEERRAAATKALRESEELLGSVFSSSPDAVTLSRLEDGTYVKVNEGFSRDLGYAQDEVIGRSATDLGIWAHAEDRARLVEKLQRQGRVENLEARFRRKDGAVITGLLSAGVFVSRGTRYLVAVTRNYEDVKRLQQERERLMQETRAAHRLMEDVFSRITEGIVALDRDWRYTYVNEQGARMLGRERPEDLLGKEIWSEYPESLEMNFRETCERAMATQRPSRVEAYYEPLKVWFETRLYPAPDGLTLFFQDITERRIAQQEVERSHERLRILRDLDQAVLAARSPGAIAKEVLSRINRLIPLAVRSSVVLFDFEADEGLVLAVNDDGDTSLPSGRRVLLHDFVISPDLVQGETRVIADLEHWDQKADVQEKLIAEGIWSVVNVPMMVQGRLIGALNFGAGEKRAFTSEDIEIAREVCAQLAIAVEHARLNEAVRRHAEELELRVAERTRDLEATNRDLRDFAYSMSHDLRTPLRAIKGFGEIISSRYRADLNEEARHYFQNIITAADNMEELINDLLEYASLGHGEMKTEVLALTPFVRRIVSGLDASGGVRGAEILLDEELPRVRAVPSLLYTLLSNLLDNALKYRKKEGAHRVEVRGGRTNQGPYVEVRDNGIGIAPENIERIFAVFQRLHTHDDYPGTGIGLAMVKKAAGLLGASVTVTSELGEGTVFRVQFADLDPENHVDRAGKITEQ